MNNSKIDWCDMSWNPITGCKHGCEYCYARRVAVRFGGGWETASGKLPVLEVSAYGRRSGKEKCQPEPYPYNFEPTFHRYRLGEPARKTRPRNIFVGSMADVFGAWVPDKWIAEVLEACEAAPQHNYLFLTKNPKRYTELDMLSLLPCEDNFWYGTTITGPNQSFFCSNFHKAFLSIEPLLEPFDTNLQGLNWVIIGAMTGPGADKHQPQREWVEEIVEDCRWLDIPVFMKGNLAGVWGEELIQEFPPELRKETANEH